ncbi:MAG: HD family phosphohydrolase [Nitrospirales bacterium]|nr:MAG: HD family phosphohydrolase [Nitrospirales bacterium]
MAFLSLNHHDDLRIGLYIKIEGSWFSHPFSTNTFKIKQAKDIETIRGLTKVKLLYDPDRSDPLSSEESSGKDVTPLLEDITEEENVPFDSNQETIAHCRVEETAETRRETYTARRKQLRKTDQAYQAVLQQSKLMYQELRTGHSKAMGRASDMVASLGKIIGDPTSSMALMNLMSAPDDVDDFFMHSLNVCALSMMLGQAFTQEEEELTAIGMGALFHDLGLLEFERTNSGPKSYRTTPDTKVLRIHPQNGRSLTENFRSMSNYSLDIIEQHHERLDGSGYPLGLLETEIGFFSKIVMAVDEYDELCNHPDITKCLTPYEALCYLYANRRGALWDKAVVALVQMLSVYPPGSLVELSDGNIGIVSSINPQARMAPWVMLYSSEIPKEEALIIDLSQEDNLSIIKSFQPKEIPYAMREYLNPRRIISYFPSENEQPVTTSSQVLHSTQ